MHDNVRNVEAKPLPEVGVSALGQILNGDDESDKEGEDNEIFSAHGSES